MSIYDTVNHNTFASCIYINKYDPFKRMYFIKHLIDNC